MLWALLSNAGDEQQNAFLRWSQACLSNTNSPSQHATRNNWYTKKHECSAPTVASASPSWMKASSAAAISDVAAVSKLTA